MEPSPYDRQPLTFFYLPLPNDVKYFKQRFVHSFKIHEKPLKIEINFEVLKIY